MSLATNFKKTLHNRLAPKSAPLGSSRTSPISNLAELWLHQNKWFHNSQRLNPHTENVFKLNHKKLLSPLTPLNYSRSPPALLHSLLISHNNSMLYPCVSTDTSENIWLLSFPRYQTESCPTLKKWSYVDSPHTTHPSEYGLLKPAGASSLVWIYFL